MRSLRRHMADIHRMSEEEVGSATNRRYSTLPRNYKLLLQGSEVHGFPTASAMATAAAVAPSQSEGLYSAPYDGPPGGDCSEL